MPISVRPSHAAREQLDQIARELRKSPASVITDLLIDALEMLETGQYGVPPTVKMLRVLRQHEATLTNRPDVDLRDRREVSFYQDDTIQAGRSTGVCCDNPPTKITLPAGFSHAVDFAVRVCGDSMEPMIHEGEVAVFRKASIAQDGRIVAALVEGQAMVKLFKAANGGPAQLVSLNPAYAPILCTDTTIIQGIYEGKVRADIIPELIKPESHAAEKPKRKRAAAAAKLPL